MQDLHREKPSKVDQLAMKGGEKKSRADPTIRYDTSTRAIHTCLLGLMPWTQRSVKQAQLSPSSLMDESKLDICSTSSDAHAKR